VSVDSITEIQLLELNGFDLKRIVKMSPNGNIIEMSKISDTIEIGYRKEIVDSLYKYVMNPIIQELFQSNQNSIDASQKSKDCAELIRGKEKGKYLCIEDMPMYPIDALNIEYNNYIHNKGYVFKIWFGKHRVYYNYKDYSIVWILDHAKIMNKSLLITIGNSIEYNTYKNGIELAQDSLLNQK